MPYDEHEKNGKFKRKYTDEMVVDVVQQDEHTTTSDVADALGCSPRLALERLRTLEEDGRVRALPVGNTYLWSETDD
jgi:Mn-dependent DtxR family transcriptional regulator